VTRRPHKLANIVEAIVALTAADDVKEVERVAVSHGMFRISKRSPPSGFAQRVS
jgi:hypothetical protein